MFKIKYCVAGVTIQNNVGYQTGSKKFTQELEDPNIMWYDTYQEAYEHLPAKPNFFIAPKYFVC